MGFRNFFNKKSVKKQISEMDARLDPWRDVDLSKADVETIREGITFLNHQVKDLKALSAPLQKERNKRGAVQLGAFGSGFGGFLVFDPTGIGLVACGSAITLAYVDNQVFLPRLTEGLINQRIRTKNLRKSFKAAWRKKYLTRGRIRAERKKRPYFIDKKNR